MITISNLKKIHRLFNQGLLKIQDAVAFGLNGYVLNCNNGKLTSITKEVEEQ